MQKIRSTTILAVRHKGQAAISGDGQVTLGQVVMKGDAHKIRPLHGGKVLTGFAGAAADAFTLLERFEAKLKDYQGSVPRAATELAKDWRTDKILRNLEALLIVADPGQTFLISGAGDVIEPDSGIAAIGSGGAYATAAARALYENTDLPARKIAEEAMRIAGDICIFTNKSVTIEELQG